MVVVGEEAWIWMVVRCVCMGHEERWDMRRREAGRRWEKRYVCVRSHRREGWVDRGRRRMLLLVDIVLVLM